MYCNNCNYNNHCCYALRGPTGATGPTGPAGTITVGTVAVGAPGTLPIVTNVGTAQNAILNFVIPQGPQGIQGIQGIQGPQGLTGPTGPTGAQGPAGEAATITVGTVTTGETAAVTNVGTAQNAIFDFVIPVAQETIAFANLQNETAAALTTTGNIPLTLLEENELTTVGDTVTLTEAGVYQVEYMVSAADPVDATVGLIVDGANVANTNRILDATTNTVTYNTIRTFAADTTIALGLVELTGTLNLEAGEVNAYLVIKKL